MLQHSRCLILYPITTNMNASMISKQHQIQQQSKQITYPYHNDAGVAKVWEAGACLAEYIMHNPHLICDRNVVELGAGVGLTCLVAAGVAKAKTVHKLIIPKLVWIIWRIMCVIMEIGWLRETLIQRL